MSTFERGIDMINGQALWLANHHLTEDDDPVLMIGISNSLSHQQSESAVGQANDLQDNNQRDYSRARVVIEALDTVSEELLSRYEVIIGGDHPEEAMCPLCLESLRGEAHDPSKPFPTEDDYAIPPRAAFPEIVALPCPHLFHSECLRPWLAKETTCPTCRRYVDPDLLTLHGRSAERPWDPPKKGVFETWVQGVEEERSHSLTLHSGGSEQSLVPSAGGVSEASVQAEERTSHSLTLHDGSSAPPLVSPKEGVFEAWAQVQEERDAHSLTLHSGSSEPSPVPPVEDVLEACVQAEEETEACVPAKKKTRSRDAGEHHHHRWLHRFLRRLRVRKAGPLTQPNPAIQNH